ncbi:MAG: hypothetical protein ABIR84_06210 [Candidatus Nitrotoga sp.]
MICNVHANGFATLSLAGELQVVSALTGTLLNRLYERGKWLYQAHSL